MKSVAYKLTSPSGKSYVGVTKYTAQRRWKNHTRAAEKGKASLLCTAIRKYGAKNFSLEVLCQADWEYLLDLERKLIVRFTTRQPHGYNITSGGAQCDANAGRKLSPEWRHKMSEAQKKRWASLTEEQRSDVGKKSWANSQTDRKEKHSRRTKELHADPVWRAEWERRYMEGKPQWAR